MSRVVYLATAFREAPTARAAASVFRMRGHSISSSWHDDPLEESAENDPAIRGGICARNDADLRRACTIVLLAPPDVAPRLRGGLCELMLAWAWGKRCVVVGDKLHLTLMADRRDVAFVATLDAALALLDSAQ